MSSVLFVCTGNRFRSPIAAATFIQSLKKAGMTSGWVVESAGTWATPGLSPIPSAIEAANGFGLDISNCTARIVNQINLAEYDLILVMEQGQKEAIQIEFPLISTRVYLLAEVANGLHYDIPDPNDDNNDVDEQEIANEVRDLVICGFKKIYDLAH